MNYKIVVDSCCDLSGDMKACGDFQIIPLTLEVGEKKFVDDETFDQAVFLKAVRETAVCPRSACPAPEAYKAAYECEADMVFVVALSQHLSGSYNSAVVARHLYIEEHGEDKQIHVFSSDSAASGEVLVALKLQELSRSGRDFSGIVKEASDFIWNMKTYFVLETLDFLKKNGRLTGLAAVFATALNIKPLMSADHGVIIKLQQARGMERSLDKLVSHLASHVEKPETKILGISHCNCPHHAAYVKEQLLKRVTFRDVVITNTAGVSSLYAGDGGVIVAV